MKGLIIFNDRMEDVEALATRALLVRAGLEMDSATMNPSLEVMTSYGLSVNADIILKDVKTNNYDFLVIPGGPYVAQIVDKDKAIKKLTKSFIKADKLVAAICAGPRFLGQIDALYGKKFTCFPGCEIDMPDGKYLPKKKVVKDKNIITARGAGVVYEFVFEIVKTLKNEASAKQLLSRIQY